MTDEPQNFSLFGNDLFGDPIRPPVAGPLKERFTFPPFSVLDARNGDWMDRKRAWLAIGIKSEVGRDAKAYNNNAWVRELHVKTGREHYAELKGDGTSIFDPVTCELAYRWFSPDGGQVVDPFAGGSVRGVIASLTGRRYWGGELRAEQVEANRAQIAELIGRTSYGVDELTPVELHDGVWVKRDDLLTVNGARGGKARSCWALAGAAPRPPGLVTAGAKDSPQALIVAHQARALGIPCAIHTPDGEIPAGGPVDVARSLGATIVQHQAGRNSVIIARSREYAAETGFREIPFGMTCAAAIEQTRDQVANVPAEAKRIVVPVGSGMTLAGILWGMIDRGLTTPVLGVVVGADPAKRLAEYAPPGWEAMVSLVPSGVDYSDHVHATLGPIDLDPVYEAKCRPFLEAGDLFWIVGHRDPAAVNALEPAYALGDSTATLDRAPAADLIFSCPPYGDLERYSDDPADLSTMDWEAFRAAYRVIIRKSLERLRPNRFAVFVVGDFRDPKGFFRNFAADTIDAFEACGARLYNEAVIVTPVGSAAMRATKQFVVSRKLCRTHQTMLVFCKGDPREAAKACGLFEEEVAP